MLHLKFALNLHTLAEEMIERISACWTNPFLSPIVIFPDPKLEQWFRLRWIQKKEALTGLNTMMIDKFLMEILVGNEDLYKKKLSSDMLCNVIIAYLKKKEGNSYNFELLGDEVKQYLIKKNIDGTTKLDENNLFDFAQKVASLFLEYETSRPKDFFKDNSGNNCEGILDCWKQGNLKPFFSSQKNQNVAIREYWQQKLYSAIFHKHGEEDSLLTSVFNEEAKRKKDNPITYLTIPFLYYNCLDKNNKAHFHLEKIKNQPVFIFGLSGMGQFYRVILHKFAEEQNVYAYIQNPCMEFWEDISSPNYNKAKIHHQWNSTQSIWKDNSGNILDDIQKRMNVSLEHNTKTDPDEITEYYSSKEKERENDLLCTWGKSGRDNIKLWCTASNYDFDFNIQNNDSENPWDLPQDSLLHKLQYSIANRINEISPFKKGQNSKNNPDASFTLTTAPKKEREVEYVHTSICKLLKEGANIKDILVVAPDIDSYRTSIKTVFDQDSKGFHIPFSIVDSPSSNSLTENALNDLFAIQEMKSITRPQFFSLMRNPVVQQTRKINPEEIDNWEHWIEVTNVYRNRSSKKDDWADGVKRLLLAKMTKNLVKLVDINKTLKPFSDISTSNNSSLCLFVEAIDDLKKWIELSKNKISDLNELKDNINAWISMPFARDSLKGESIIFKQVTQSIENLNYQLDSGLDSISWKIIEQSLITAAQGSAYSCGNLFVNGVTFMKFIPNRIIPVKHLFFMGCDSKNFPGTKKQNTLDLRKSVFPWPGDDSPIAKKRYAFLCQLISTSESFHISFVNQDIKKDAEIYPSSVINDLKKFFNKNAIEWHTNKMSLDETREVKDLFTPKSIRNKIAYTNMVQNGSNPINKTEQNKNTQEYQNVSFSNPDRVSMHQLQKFLEDPFEFKISNILLEQGNENSEKDLFEPIFFNKLEKSNLIKKSLAIELSGDENEINNFIRDIELKGKMPDSVYRKKTWEEINEKKQTLKENIEINIENDIIKNWSYNRKLEDLQLNRSNGTKWNLTGSMDWCNNKKLEDVTEIFSITTSEIKMKDFPLSKYLGPYIKALAILALKCEKYSKTKDKIQTIDIYIYTCNQIIPCINTKVQMSPNEAKCLLEKIYMTAFGDKENNIKPFCKAIPIDLIEISEKLLEKGQWDIYTYKDLLNDSWNYFEKKYLFNPLYNVGFSRENSLFIKEWVDAINKMKSLIKIKPFELSDNTKKGAK